MPQRTILFAGGGTGGHIYPNLAVLERLQAAGAGERAHFLVSRRPLDAQLLNKEGIPCTGLSAAPLRGRPIGLLHFLLGFWQSRKMVRQIIRETNAVAMVATGGFVSGPAVAAARRAGLPVALVNLDAVPGRANRLLARRATKVFTVYPTPQLPRAQRIGLPLRQSVRLELPAGEARARLGLARETPTLLVTAGSQGATSVNRMMIALLEQPTARAALADWQVVHLTGDHEREAVTAAYEKAGVRARVEPFYYEMGVLWRAATLAVSRAGAGSVAEAWAHRVPTIFFPYPYHKDQHQRLNAKPLVDVTGAIMLPDRVEPQANAEALLEPLLMLMGDPARRQAMRTKLSDAPPDGAETVATWLLEAIAGGAKGDG